MTTEEFSNEFDTLLGSYSVRQGFGEDSNPLNFNEYEKSVFLTEAQESIIVSLYTGKNPVGDSFEKTEEMRKCLGSLVKTYVPLPTEEEYIGLSDESVFYKLPEGLWYITYESVTLEDDRLGCRNGTTATVIPVTQDDFYRTVQNPFKCPSDRKVLRLDIRPDVSEIVSKYRIGKYLIRYISKPDPIILVTLPDNLSIRGIKERTECSLNPILHRIILKEAVRLAITSRVTTK